MTSPLLFAFAAVLSAASATGASSHPFSVHDMVAMDRISEPRASLDGNRIVFVVRTTDLEANAGKYSLWLVGADGTGLRRLTSPRSNDRSPRWAPDGKTIFFLSTRSGSSQVWRISADGGEAEQVTDLPLDVDNLIISPDGHHLGFTMEVFPGTSFEDTKKKLDQKEKQKATGRTYDRLFIRHWDTWSDGRRSHLFVMPSAGKPSPIDVMALHGRRHALEALGRARGVHLHPRQQRSRLHRPRRRAQGGLVDQFRSVPRRSTLRRRRPA